MSQQQQPTQPIALAARAPSKRRVHRVASAEELILLSSPPGLLLLAPSAPSLPATPAGKEYEMTMMVSSSSEDGTMAGAATKSSSSPLTRGVRGERHSPVWGHFDDVVVVMAVVMVMVMIMVIMIPSMVSTRNGLISRHATTTPHSTEPNTTAPTHPHH